MIQHQLRPDILAFGCTARRRPSSGLANSRQTHPLQMFWTSISFARSQSLCRRTKGSSNRVISVRKPLGSTSSRLSATITTRVIFFEPCSEGPGDSQHRRHASRFNECFANVEYHLSRRFAYARESD